MHAPGASAGGTRIAALAWEWCISLTQRPCADLRQLKCTHALFVTHGFYRNTFALSRLVLLAANSATTSPSSPAPAAHFLGHASLLFHHAETPPNSFIYNTLIRAHSRSSEPHQALSFFHLMLRRHRLEEHGPTGNAAPDHHTYPFVLHACASIPSLLSGVQVHSCVFKNGLASADHFVQTALLRFYVRFMTDNSDSDARKVFDEIPHRDAVHWDVLLNGYLRCNLATEALSLFGDLLLSDVEPDNYIITTALAACAHAGALEQGIWIHSYLERKKRTNPQLLIDDDLHIGTALVTMYAKCGSIEKAVAVFDEMPRRNAFSWAAMIGGFAMHGSAKEAISCLDRMREVDGLRPDGISLLGILTACSHAGLVEEGELLFAQMETRYGVLHKHEHYSCTIDLLCRVGRLKEAVELIDRMPMKPLASVWGSLLTGCRIHGNVELAELAVEELLKLNTEPNVGVGDCADDGVFVQLSNIYLHANRREDARRVRKLIGSRGMKKTPGCSVIEVDGMANSFVAGDQVHPLRLEIGDALNLLAYQIFHESSQDMGSDYQV